MSLGLHTWTDGDTVEAADINGNFTLIEGALVPTGIDDDSSSIGEMQGLVDPYPGSSESLSTNLQGEFRRIRYQLKAILGEAQWYIDAAGSIADIFTNSAITFAGTKTFSGAITFTGGISGSISDTLGIGITPDAATILHTYTASSNKSIRHESVSSANESPSIEILKANGVGTAVLDTREVGIFKMLAHDGTAYNTCLQIKGIINGTVATGQTPTDMVFKTDNISGVLTERLRLASDGAATFADDVTVTGDVSAVAGSFSGAVSANTLSISEGTVVSGTYNPTESDESNCAVANIEDFQWIRVGNVVTVTGSILNVNPTAASFAFFNLTLPVASNFTGTDDCSGVGYDSEVSVECSADISNNKVRIGWLPTSTSIRDQRYCFMYKVI